nr:overexpressed in colon carcinoma 1 protein isoform X1 [Peromyscus maniculatus bairdii]
MIVWCVNTGLSSDGRLHNRRRQEEVRVLLKPVSQTTVACTLACPPKQPAWCLVKPRQYGKIRGRKQDDWILKSLLMNLEGIWLQGHCVFRQILKGVPCCASSPKS